MKRKIRHRPEQLVHRAVVQHLTARGAPGIFFCHVPNGGKRSAVEGAIFKAMGVRAGVPDILIFRAGHAYALELKADKRKPSPVQIQCHDELRAAGVTVDTACGLDEALAWLEKWSFVRGRAS